MYLALAVLACSQHDPAGPGPGDQTPPHISEVAAWDKTHLIVVFDERVTRETADNALNYKLAGPVDQPKMVPLRDGGDGGPDTVCNVCTASLHPDNRTVTLTTQFMDSNQWSIHVHGVSDVHGNEITKTNRVNFEGTDGPDVTPPEVVFQSPEPDASGVSPGGYVRVQFSEAVIPASVTRGFLVTGPGAQRISIRNEDPIRYDCDLAPLQPNAEYLVALTGVEDLAGNRMPDMQWTFQTAETADTLAPMVRWSNPQQAAFNVELDTPLSISFTEPMDPYSVRIRGDVNSTAVRWSNGGRKVTFATTWEPDWQYTIQIRPGDMRDLAGNAGTQLFTLSFATGSTVSAGGFSGTVAGDLSSNDARDPAGALVFATSAPDHIFSSVVALVGSNHAYQFSHLLDGTYYPVCVVDSNHDGLYQLQYGDAVGIFGMPNPWLQKPEAVEIHQSSRIGIDFPIYDPAAVYGVISSDGTSEGPLHVGLFRTADFDPTTSVPVISIIAVDGGTWDYVINELDVGPIAAGSYYVAAYMDLSDDGLFNPGDDPMGVYGGDTPIEVHVAHGLDVSDVNIVLHDPSLAVHTNSVRWPITKRTGKAQPFIEALEKASD
ncbi:MAG TPA: Ig-like domain-containing protein [Candidatus Krumholzibacteria bacterium]|nr:Ig-like domain-containing protein [Candidatus Krumholzibacteria bacterium]